MEKPKPLLSRITLNPIKKINQNTLKAYFNNLKSIQNNN